MWEVANILKNIHIREVIGENEKGPLYLQKKMVQTFWPTQYILWATHYTRFDQDKVA